MLIAEPVKACSRRYLCLDALPATFERGERENAILLEVWSGGGLLQTESSPPAGSLLMLWVAGGEIPARVESCTTDEYGCLLEFSVDNVEHWFPQRYCPARLRPAGGPGS